MPPPPATPRVTVLVPVRDGGRFLRPALDSVLAQSFGDFELLVVDDGSTDGSPEAVASLGDPRVRLVLNGTNLGVALSLDRGMGLARGTYVARMDADDLCLPGRLAAQVRFLDAHPDVGAVGTAVTVVDGEGRPVETFRYPEGHDRIRFALFYANPLAHPSVMLRPEAVRAAGGYAPAERRGALRFFPEDYDLWRRLSAVSRLANLPGVHLLLRRHGGNVMTAQGDAYLAGAAAVCSRMAAERLGGEVPAEAAAALLSRRCGSPEAAEAACRLAARLCASFLLDPSVPAGEKRRIRRDGADLVLSLLRAGAGTLSPGAAARAARALGPSYPLRLAGSAGRRAAARIASALRPGPRRGSLL